MKKDVKKIGHLMNKEKVTKWVKKYQKENPNEVHGWLYGCDVLEELLNADGSCGIWFFKGINDEGQERLVLYPADSEGNILGNQIKSLGAAANGGGLAGDDGEECPPNCPIFG